MALDIDTIVDQVASHAAATGWFERVNSHEPKNAPGNGQTAAVWFQSVAPVRSSGLNSTSALLVLTVRLYQNMLAEPQDEIDPDMVKAMSALIGAYSGDFELGSQVRSVDLLGQTGTSLSARAGYLDISGRMHRIIDITVPLIVNDVWEQTP